MYVQLVNLKSKAEEQREVVIQHKLQMSQYLHSMRKMDRIIRDCQDGKLDYLQYLEFFKSIDSSLVKSLNLSIRTSHSTAAGGDKKRMFDAPFKSYQSYKCNKMLVTVTGRSRLPQYTEMAITSDEKGEDILQIV